MIRKFAKVPEVRVVLTAVTLSTILAGTTALRAQQPPAQQPPAQQPSSQSSAQQPENQQPSSEEASPEETTRRRKPQEYKNWNFNVGGGAATYSGATKQFVRGGGLIGAAGVARNYSKYFGLRADFQYDNLPLRNSALGPMGASAPGANSHVYTLMVDPIINLPFTKEWSGYIVFGPSFYHRSGKLDSSTAIPGSPCNAFFTWWGKCFASSLPVNGNFLHASQNEFGENFGGGVARRIRPNLEIYAEYRLAHGTSVHITTDLRPITIGVRW